MSLFAACWWSVLRDLSIVLTAAPLCWLLSRFLRSVSCEGRDQRPPSAFFLANRSAASVASHGAQPAGFGSRSPKLLAWVLLLIPFLTPDLLVGYAYVNFGPPLVRYPLLNELLYWALLWLKLVPVGTVVLYCSPPPPLTAEAHFCRRMSFGTAQKPGFFKNPGFFTPDFNIARVRDFIHGPARQLFPAVGLMFLLAFQEFELSALLGIMSGRSGSPVSWTRLLFDNQQGVIDRLAPLRWSLWPLICELSILLPMLLLARNNRHLLAREHAPVRRPRRITRAFVWSYFCGAVVVLCVLPFVFVIRESVGGVDAFLANRQQLTGLRNEVVAGLMFASIAGILAYTLAMLPFVPIAGRAARQFHRLLSFVLLAPGLAGALIVGLAILYLFQTELLYRWYDTPLPLGIALILFLAPRAYLLQLLLRVARPREPVHLAHLLRQSAFGEHRRQAGTLLWKLSRQQHFWAAVLLASWAYWDLTSTSILAPTNMVPATVRLYNNMHYGHNAFLSIMTLLAIAAPLIVVFVSVLIVRALVSRFV